jgi:hypothetical protein
MNLNKFHTYSTYLFSIYGTLHVLHHFLAATILSPDWHVAVQQQFMPRGLIGEKLLIWLPVSLSYISGWMLIWKNKTQLVRSIKATLSYFKSFLFGAEEETTKKNDDEKNGTNTNNNSSALSKIRHVQYVSSLLLGVCLSAHLPAVFGLRYLFKDRNQEPVTVFTACNEMHNSATPKIAHYIFVGYYAALVASFFTHAACGFATTRIKDALKNTQQKKNDDNDGIENKQSDDVFYFNKVVVPSIYVSILLGAVTAVGLYLKTNEEICERHSVKELISFSEFIKSVKLPNSL